MHSNSKDIENVKMGRAAAVIIVLLMLLSLAPVLPAQGTAPGYLVFRDTVPIGPGLDARFHAIVPDGVAVLGADLHIYGTQGVLPVAADSVSAGPHDHSISQIGPHSHGLLASDEHDHTVSSSGDHDHQVTVYNSNVDTEDAEMSVDLPSHTHTFNGVTRVVDLYDFPPVTSNDHNHTAPAHSHNTLIGQGGDHDHTTDLGGDHVHDLPTLGDHGHDANVTGEHQHPLEPGWTPVDDGVRPSGVELSITVDQVTTDIPGIHGSVDADWDATIDLDGMIGSGISTLTLTSDTHGMLEYVLVVEIDHAYGVISGQGALGPSGVLEVPVWAPPSTLSATAYLFGGDLTMIGTMADIAGNHTHDALADGDHNHSVQSSLDHTHIVGGGDHEHEGYASSSTPGTTSSTPLWTLPTHRHDLSWMGNTLTGISPFNYGRKQSSDHNHQVVDHDHSVTVNVSGEHEHNMSTEDLHVHAEGPGGDHDHGSSMSVDHSHPLVFSPASVTSGGPEGVTAQLDGIDITVENGGPWNLSGTPAAFDLDPPAWTDPVSLNLSSSTEGSVEWVVMVELDDPLIMVSAHGITGDLVAHVPVPGVVGGAKVGALGSPYVMPISDQTIEDGIHGHTTSSEGDHTHASSEAGNHTHDLSLGVFHVHGLTLNDTVVEVMDANGTVDLGPHTHTAPLGGQASSQTPVAGTTGTHSHQTVSHVHDLNWTTVTNHVHAANLSGNHTHEEAVNGSHVHTMEGGDHDHGLQAGVHFDAAYPSPVDVDVKFGDTHPGVRLDGGGARWWEEFTVGAGHLDAMSMEVLTASSGQVGTMSFVVWFLLDLQPPEPTLIYAPDWVMPDDQFKVIVGVPDDIDPASISLEIGPVVIDNMDHNASNGTIEFECNTPTDAVDGRYDIDFTASDNVGNKATTTLGFLGIDGTLPVVTMSIGEPKVPDEGITWVTSGTPVNLTILDATSGPGVLQYAFAEDGPWQDYDPVNDNIFEGQDEGGHTLYVKGADKAGNWASTQNVDVNIDDTGPQVDIRVMPAVPGENSDEVIASPESVISFLEDDGDGVGTETVLYQIDAVRVEPEREYDRPFPVSSVDIGVLPFFTVTWFASDGLGNVQDATNELTVRINPVAPIPSPEGDLFLPTHVTESPLTVQGRIPGNVARFHYRIDGGSGGVIDITPDTTFDFIVNLNEGPNTLLYTLESPVGVMSQWVVGGVIHLDTEDPDVIGVDPAEGSRDLRTKGLSVGMHFSEPVIITAIEAKVNGKAVGSSVLMHTQNTSATLIFDKDPPGNALIELKLTYEDLAGHEVETAWSYKTRTPTLESSATGVILGLVAGLIIGVMLMFFITFKRKEPMAIVHEGGVVTTSIISPDEHMSWHDEDEGEDDDDDEDLEEEDAELEDDEEKIKEDLDDGDEPEPAADVPDDWEEGDLQEDEGEDPEDKPESEPQKGGVMDDLEDEIDRLLEDTSSGEDGATEALPDPEEQTIDGGSRF